MSRTSSKDDGYALLVAVTAVAAFACIAFQVLALDQGTIAAVSGQARQARLVAAADAGANLAIHALGADDRGQRWSLDGRPRHLDFDGIDLTVTIEDERGKASLSNMSDPQARALFSGAGVGGDRLYALVAEFRYWQTNQNDDPDAPSPFPAGFPVRHGFFRTVGELMALKDMDAKTFARVAPSVTSFFEETGAFDPSNASPLARRAMSADDGGGDSSDEAGQTDEEPQADTGTTDEDLAPDDHYLGRTLTVRSVARDSSGGRAERAEIIEMTGDPAHPYWVRYAD
jgi:hypothetical protein